MNSFDISEKLAASAKIFSKKVSALRFADPVSHVYNPLEYAWEPHALYLQKYANSRKKVVFLGMNPGPFGMVQTGVPFGEIRAVRDWLGISGKVTAPTDQHPKRLVTGFECPRSEISGQRLWGLFQERFETPGAFFKQHLVMNYCPLAFLERTGRNRTPNKLAPAERAVLYAACDEHFQTALAQLQPEWIVGVGDFAARRAEDVAAALGIKLGQILHPSPASPLANRGWGASVTGQLKKLGIWK